jgi:hypothetical protein
MAWRDLFHAVGKLAKYWSSGYLAASGIESSPGSGVDHHNLPMVPRQKYFSS